MFKDWNEDTPKIIGDCIAHDFKFWKVPRFIRDLDVQLRVVEIVKTHFEKLKEIFICAVAAAGESADLKKIKFYKMMLKSGVADKKLTTGIIDGYFIATNFEAIEQENNDDNALCRYEFLEILVRIAQGKYIVYGQEKDLGRALEKLLVEHIFPYHEHLGSWELWRREELWCVDVQEYLLVNLRGIKDLYASISKTKLITTRRNRAEIFDRSIVTVDQLRQALRLKFDDF